MGFVKERKEMTTKENVVRFEADVCLQQQSWYREDQGEWMRCVASLLDREQTIILSAEASSGTCFEVTASVLLAIGLNGAEISQVQLDDADTKPFPEASSFIQINLEPSPNCNITNVKLSQKDASQIGVWIAALKRASFPCAKFWNSRGNEHCKNPISRLKCPKAGKVSNGEKAHLDIFLESLKLSSINSSVDENGRQIPAEEVPLILRKKLFGCTIDLDAVHLHHGENIRQQAAISKHETVKDVLDFVCNTSARQGQLDAVALSDYIEMIRVNVMRPLNIYDNGELLITVDGENLPAGRSRFMSGVQRSPMEAPDWCTLSLVYESLLELVNSKVCDMDVKRRCISSDFCRDFLQLFATRDPREREYVKSITHCMYSKLVGHRVVMRTAMANLCLEFTYDFKVNNGIAEMLEVFGSIASGFVTPLKEEHKRMLLRCLLPLYSARGSEYFFEQLSFVVQQFVNKDQDLIVPATLALLRYWPKRNAAKQILFLGELGELASRISQTHFEKVETKLMDQLCACISGPHFQVAEYAMGLLNNNYIYVLIFDNPMVCRKLVPTLLAALGNASISWNATVKQIGKDIIEYIERLELQESLQETAKQNDDEDETARPKTPTTVKEDLGSSHRNNCEGDEEERKSAVDGPTTKSIKGRKGGLSVNVQVPVVSGTPLDKSVLSISNNSNNSINS